MRVAALLSLTALVLIVSGTTPAPALASTAFAPTCLSSARQSSEPLHSRIGVVKATFTATPYSSYEGRSFYSFYRTYAGATGNVTTDLSLLTMNVTSASAYNSGWGQDLLLRDFLDSQPAKKCGLFMNQNVRVVTDLDVNQGALFLPNGSRTFDFLVLGHEEYVTQAEYDQLRSFVASGGTIVTISANILYAKVHFDPATRLETLLIGHGWAFNGKSAWRTTFAPFYQNNTDWFGSNYCCRNPSSVRGATASNETEIGRNLIASFGNPIFTTFHIGEANMVTNLTKTSLVATFWNRENLTASYAHDYRGGRVISLGVYGDDLVGYDNSVQYFLVLALAGERGAGLSIMELAIVAVAAAAVAIPVVVLLARWAVSRKALRQP